MVRGNSRSVIAVILAGTVGVGMAQAQRDPPALQLTSVEWLAADSDTIVRGIIVDVTPDDAIGQPWNIITLDVQEILKGAKAQRLSFAAHKFPRGDAILAEAKNAKQEVLWILKRRDPATAGEAPNREKTMARHKLELYALFVPGRPGEPTLPVIPLSPDPQKAEFQMPPFLTMKLQVLKTPDEFVKAIREAIVEESRPGAWYNLVAPREAAQLTGFSRMTNLLMVPSDRRLENVARGFVQSPGDYFTKECLQAIAKESPNGKLLAQHTQMLRLEGVKALRQFPSEKNLAVIRAWLDDPMSTKPYAAAGPANALVPSRSRNQQADLPVTLARDLADVPEIHFQEPLTKAMGTREVQLHTAVTIDTVQFLNQKKTDAFIETLMKKRPDLGGLAFAMGDSCRMKPDAGKQFVAALELFRKVGDPNSPMPPGNRGEAVQGLMKEYQVNSADQKIPHSASVAALMQVLAPEDEKTRLALVKYLEGLAHADATQALAKLAIFSLEPDVRSAAVKALKARDVKAYTGVLLAGLNYPWPKVAERSTEAMTKLERKDLVPQLIDMLEKPDPRAPVTRDVEGNTVSVVRELVRVNHHHSCLLCHAPARDSSKPALESLTAQVPVPSESMTAYYRPSNPDILVRFDVTYLRQDFSLMQRVANADPWPEMQRYDYLVRTREVTAKQAEAYQKLLATSVSPYRQAALSALRQLTGRDAEPTAAAWRKLAGL